jgi:hypothetical protein
MNLLQIGLLTCVFVMEGHSLQWQAICFWAQWFWVLFCAQKFLMWSCIPYTSYTSFEVISGFIIPVQVLFLLWRLTQVVLLGVLGCSSSQQHVMCNKEFSCENSNQGMDVVFSLHLYVSSSHFHLKSNTREKCDTPTGEILHNIGHMIYLGISSSCFFRFIYARISTFQIGM